MGTLEIGFSLFMTLIVIVTLSLFYLEKKSSEKEAKLREERNKNYFEKYQTKIKELPNIEIPSEVIQSFAKKNPIYSQIEIRRFEIALIDFFNMHRFNVTLHDEKPLQMPSKKADLLWHEFLLFEELYEKFCMTHFGKIFNHKPNEEMTEKQIVDGRNNVLRTLNNMIIFGAIVGIPTIMILDGEYGESLMFSDKDLELMAAAEEKKDSVNGGGDVTTLLMLSSTNNSGISKNSNTHYESSSNSSDGGGGDCGGGCGGD